MVEERRKILEQKALKLSQETPRIVETPPKNNVDLVNKDMPVLREQMVSTATDFLSHPKVDGASNESKIKFLKNKGLSDAEINEAFKRLTGRKNNQTIPMYNRQNHMQVQNGRPIPNYLIQPFPFKSFIFLIIICAGFGNFLFYVIKKYLIPYFFTMIPPFYYKNKEKIGRYCK